MGWSENLIQLVCNDLYSHTGLHQQAPLNDDTDLCEDMTADYYQLGSESGTAPQPLLLPFASLIATYCTRLASRSRGLPTPDASELHITPALLCTLCPQPC